MDASKTIFVGKPAGELWASEKNELRAAIAREILGKLQWKGFWAVSFRCEQ